MTDISGTMNFLNEAARRYPDATSLLAGRPPDVFVDSAPITRWIDNFVASAADPGQCRSMLGQYSDTNGVCLDVFADYLSRSLQMSLTAADCMVINGAQEGMLIALASLCGRDKIALAADPTYVGFAGAAGITGTRVETVLEDDDFVQRLIDRLAANDPQVGCVYLVPDFANPTGRVLSLAERVGLIEAARESGIVLIEDIAYRRYRFAGDALPTLFQLADGQNVIILESFAKSVMPGLRAGVLATRKQDDCSRKLAEKLSTTKSYASVTTSPIIQAALAGCLLENMLDLDLLTNPRVQQVRGQRDALLAALTESVRDEAIAWSSPTGGFFLTLQLQRDFGLDDCLRCAKEAKVLVLPMQAFSMSGNFANQIRLSFSNVPASQFGAAIPRLWAWLEAAN